MPATSHDLSIVPDAPAAQSGAMRTKLRAVFCDSRLTAIDRRVWFLLSAHANADGESWPHAITMAAALGVHPKTVEQSLRTLRECNLIGRFRDATGRLKW